MAEPERTQPADSDEGAAGVRDAAACDAGGRDAGGRAAGGHVAAARVSQNGRGGRQLRPAAAATEGGQGTVPATEGGQGTVPAVDATVRDDPSARPSLLDLPLARAFSMVVGMLRRWRGRLSAASLRRLARSRRAAGVLFVTVVGSAIGAALAPATTATVGPLQVDIRVLPSLRPGVALDLPPAGRVEFATHEAPVSVEAAISEVDLDGARQLIGSRTALTELERTAPDTLRGAAVRAAITSGGCALAGAVGLSLLVYRRRARRTAQVAVTLVAVLATTSMATVATFDPDRMAQPQFTGLLSKAPYIAGQAESVLQRLQNYRAGLAQIVQGVTALYATTGDLPTLPGTTSADDVVTLLHVSDIHLNPIAFDLINRLVPQFKVDLVVDTGDITTWGTDTESATLSRVRQVGVPYVFVRGNHDSRRTQAAVAASPNAVVLDGDVAQVAGVVIAGIGDPIFTPDVPQNGNVPSPTASPNPSGTSSARATAGPSPTVGSRSAPAGDTEESADPEIRAGERLAGVIRRWDATHPGKPVTIAAMHEPFGVAPLFGTVPLVLSGHFHRRYVQIDKATGTRVMVEGSTGGSGVTATGVEAAARGEPTPLDATLIYLARRGPRAGQVLAYDEVTVGGLGLASVSLARTVVRPEQTPTIPGNATVTSTPGTSTSGTPTPATPGTATPATPSAATRAGPAPGGSASGGAPR